MESSTWNKKSINKEFQPIYYLENKKPCPEYSFITYPDGGLYSSVNDLTLLLQEVMKGYKGEGKLLSKEAYQIMLAPAFQNEDLPYGICWDLEQSCCIGHGGNDFGTATMMYLHKESGIGRIFFTNISICLLYTSPSPRDATLSRMPSSA